MLTWQEVDMNCFILQYQKQALILHYFLFYQEENNTDKGLTTLCITPVMVQANQGSLQSLETNGLWTDHSG